jgi:hypothetical protein
MDLVAGYGAYSDAPELNLQAAADAPATTPVCLVTISISTVGVSSIVANTLGY